MNDAPLLDYIESSKLARRHDPETSHMAARKVVERGITERNREKIRAYLRSIDPRDDHYKGIAAATGIDETEVGRRLSDLVKLGDIIITGRRLMDNGNKGTTYRIAGKALAA